MDIYFALQSDSDGSPMTGEASNVTVYISKDGVSFAATTNAAAEIGRGAYKVTLTSAEAAFSTLLYAPVCTGAQSNIYQLDAAPAIPTASDNAQAVWGAQTKVVTIDSTQAATLATAAALSTVGDNVSAVKAKTDNLPSSPAAVGSEMALTSATISAVQNELATSSELSALESHGDSNWSTATGFATPSDLSGLSTFNASTDKVTLNTTEDGTLTAIKTKVDTLTNTDLTGIATSTDISNAQTAIISRGNEAWLTATGFTVPSDLSNLATAGDISGLASYGDTKWLTATGFATPSDIPSASDNASAVWSATSRTLTESALTAADVWSYSTRTLTASALTAQEVWEYSTRELTSSPTDISGLATSQDISDLQTHGDASWATATGFATPADIPTDYAKPGDTMTLTSSTLASVITGVWNYDNRTLTQEIVSQVTAEDIASISIAVWSYVPRKLTSIVSDVIEPNK